MSRTSSLVKLFSKDIQRHFGISAGSVEVLRQIYFYQHGSLAKCIAGKNTIAKHSRLSRRAVFYSLRQLHLKGVIHRNRRQIIVSTAFLRYFELLKQKYQRLKSWEYYSKIKVCWLWKKCGQSVENLYRKIFAYGDACTSFEIKLHPNRRLNSSEFNNNRSLASLTLRRDKSARENEKITQEMVLQVINELSAEQIKEIYLEKLKQKDNLKKFVS